MCDRFTISPGCWCKSGCSKPSRHETRLKSEGSSLKKPHGVRRRGHPMKKAMVLIALALSGLSLGAQAQAPADRLHQFFSDYWEARLRESPELATQVGRTEYNHLWSDYSRTAR